MPCGWWALVAPRRPDDRLVLLPVWCRARRLASGWLKVMRLLMTWSWLVAATSTAAMLAPHVPLLLAQEIANRIRSQA
jgi:hypothetical protein